MKALISPNDVITQEDGTEGFRVCEIHAEGFDVASPLFWVDYDGSLKPSESIYINDAVVERTFKEQASVAYTMPITDFGA